MGWISDSMLGFFYRERQRNFAHRKMLEAKLETATFQVKQLFFLLENSVEDQRKLKEENRVLRGWVSKRFIDETEHFLGKDE